MTTGQFNFEIRANTKDFTSGMQSAERSVESFQKESKKATTTSKKLGDTGSKSASNMKAAYAGLGAVIAGIGVGRVFAKMVENTSRQQAALAQLNQTLASTEGVAGKTAEELTATAGELQKITRYGDEAIIEMQSLLLTFKDIKGDQFDETSKAVLDMATAMGTDLKSAAIQLGKALNDPAKNLSALSRSGITFSESQTQMVKDMQAVGDMAGAQTLILAELESQFGGSAEAARGTLGGALEGLSNAWNDLFEASSESTEGMVESINKLEAAVSSQGLQDGLNLIGTTLGLIAENSAKVAKYTPAALFGEGIADAIDYARSLGLITDELDRQGEALTETVDLQELLDGRRRERLAALDQEAGLTKKKTAADLKEIKVTAKSYKLKKETVKVIKEVEKAERKRVATLEKAERQLQKNLAANEAIIESIEFENELYGLSEDAIELETEKRKLNADATDEQVRALERAVKVRQLNRQHAENDAAMAEIVAAANEDAAERTSDAWEKGFESMQDVIGGFLENGELDFKGLSDTFSDMILSMQDDANGLGIDFSQLGKSLALGASAYAQSQELFGETTGAGAAVGTAIGAYYGGQYGAAAGGFIGDAFEGTFFGQDNDGDNTGYAKIKNGVLKAEGIGKSFNQGNVDQSRALLTAAQEFADTIGGADLEGFRVDVDNNNGIRYGGQTYGQDAEGFFEDIFRDVVEQATDLSEGMKELVIGFEGTNEEFLQFIEAMFSLRDNAGINSVTEAINNFNEANTSLATKFADSNAGVQTLIENFDGSAAAADELAQAFHDSKNAGYEYATSILAIGQAMQESADRQAKSIRESVMTEEELFKVREKERDALIKSLDTLTDPAEIEKAGQEILNLNKKLFDSLSEEQQEKRAEEFATIAEDTAEVARDVLDIALDKAQLEAEETNARIQLMLDGVAEKQQVAADVALEAANKQLAASERPVQVEVTVNTETGEVNQ